MTILHKLQSEALIDPPHYVLDNLCYLVKGGSHAYGTNNPDSDVDLIGFCIPPSKYLFPTSFGYIYGYDDLPKFEQFVKHGLEYEGTEYDITVYNITKFANLAVKGNPNVIEILYFDESEVLFENEVGKKFRNHRNKFLSQECYNRFMGFAKSHYHKMINRKYSEGRKHIVDKFSFETKDCSHLMRAYAQAYNIIVEHTIKPKVFAAYWRRIKEGYYSLEEMKKRAEQWENLLKNKKEKTTLRYKPDRDGVRELLMEVI